MSAWPAGRTAPVLVGSGTVGYLAPERIQPDAAHDSAGPQADIYSLGMVLFEMLTGHRPFEHSASYSVLPLQIEAMATERSKAAPSLRNQRSDVSWGLESIVQKCLAPEPVNRYQQAEQLAEDLRRWFDYRPLRYAPELSHVERVRKWTRRHPRLSSVGVVTLCAASLLFASGVALVTTRQHLAGTQEQLDTVQAQERKRSFEAGTLQAMCLVNTTTGLKEHQAKGMQVCEETLALYDLLSSEKWEEPPDWLHLPQEHRERLAEDTRELFLLLAAVRVQMAPTDPTVLQNALSLLRKAEAIPTLAPSKALSLDRARYFDLLGETQQAQSARRQATEIPASSARDHYLMATALARLGKSEHYASALSALERALVLEPRHYWSWLQRGICHTELGEFVLAAGDFGHCAGLWPDFAWGHFNLGYVQAQSGNQTEAVLSYSNALSCEPNLLAARYNRGLACLELKRYKEALEDLDFVLAQGRSDASLLAGRGVALVGLGHTEKAEEAFQQAFTQSASLPRAARLQIRSTYGFAMAEKAPAKAHEAFEEIIRQEPNHTQALYGLSMLAMTQGNHPEALRHFNRTLQLNPTFVAARRYRAVLLARNGFFPEAREDINWCLANQPNSGDSYYVAACVVALAAKQHADQQLSTQALELLAKALAHGVGAEKAANDPDLVQLKESPRFRQLLAQAASTAQSKN